MTAEERAKEIVSRRLSDLANGDWEPVIAECAREAALAERAACAAVAEAESQRLYRLIRSISGQVGQCQIEFHAGESKGCDRIARAIRARVAP